MPDLVTNPERVEPIVPEAKAGATDMATRFKEAFTPKEAEPPKTEPPVAPVAPSEPDPLASASPKARENFKRLEEKARQEEQKRQELEARLAEVEAGTKAFRDTEKQLREAKEAAEARAADAELFRKRYGLEHDPQFAGHYAGKIGQAIAKAKLLVPPEAATKVERIFALPPSDFRDEAVRKLREELPEEAPALISVYADLKLVQQERDEELSRTKVEFNYSKLQERQKQEQEAALAKDREIRERFWEKLEPDVEAELKPLEEVAKEDLPQAKKLLKSMVNGELDAAAYADVVKAAARGLKAAKTEAKKDELIKQLSEQVAALKSATPGIKASGEGKQVEKTPGERFREAMAGAQKG